MGPEYQVPLPDSDQFKVEWVYSGKTSAEESELLTDAVRGRDLDVDGLYVFGAAEKVVAWKVRSALRERGLGPERMRITPYWYTHSHH